MKKIRILVCVTILCALITGCAPKQEPVTTQIFAMNTMMSLTAEGAQAQDAVNRATETIYTLERFLSVTDEQSDIWAMNHSEGEWTSVSDTTYSIVGEALDLAKKTDGAFDPTIYPALTAWGFTTGDYRVPSAEELRELASLVDYTAVELDETTRSIRMPAGMELDLGGIAKGYTVDVIADILMEYNIDRALLNLGGNVYVMGTKADKSQWQVGIQSPEDSSTLASVSVDGDMCVITSGGYQRFFEEDGVTYWHILDPETGAPAQTDLRSVTIIDDGGTQCDALSTALFVMGRAQAEEFCRAHSNINVVLVDEDGNIYITPNLEGSFAILDGVSATVEVMTP